MITVHGRTRQQQRGIPHLVVEWLQRFGREQHDGHGAIVFYFDRRARRHLERCVGREPVRRMHEYLDSYAVVGTTGEVRTVGRRYDRVRK